MDLSSLINNNRTSRKRIGRGHGSGHGKTSTRGHKGQKARSGYKRKMGFEGGQMPLNRRLPKRGFKHADRFPQAVVNLDTLDAHFESGAEIDADVLVKAGLARPMKGGVKILGRGEVSKPLSIEAASVSASARTKIEAAGGTVQLSSPAPKASSAEAGQA